MVDFTQTNIVKFAMTKGPPALTHAILAADPNGGITLGVMWEDGSLYAGVTLEQNQFLAALAVLGVIELPGFTEAEDVGFKVGSKVHMIGSQTEGIVLSSPMLTQRVQFKDQPGAIAMDITQLRPCRKRGESAQRPVTE